MIAPPGLFRRRFLECEIHVLFAVRLQHLACVAAGLLGMLGVVVRHGYRHVANIAACISPAHDLADATGEPDSDVVVLVALDATPELTLSDNRAHDPRQDRRPVVLCIFVNEPSRQERVIAPEQFAVALLRLQARASYWHAGASHCPLSR